MRRIRVLVEGHVQGVFFRGATREEARRLGVTGYARNLPDGRVEIVAQGADEALHRLLEWSRRGPPYARVSGVHVEELPASDDLPDFTVRY